ncbi:MAG: hypothetical protein AB2615_21090, partial [Candidatus Thiodiazotropha sp.]
MTYLKQNGPRRWQNADFTNLGVMDGLSNHYSGLGPSSGRDQSMKTKILLKEAEMPTHWYNVVADMPNPP